MGELTEIVLRLGWLEDRLEHRANVTVWAPQTANPLSSSQIILLVPYPPLAKPTDRLEERQVRWSVDVQAARLLVN